MSRSRGPGIGVALLLALLLGASAVPAQAQEHGRHEAAREEHRDEHYDARHNHNRYYPNHGAAVHALPGQPVAVAHGGAPYYYSRGVWYAPSGPHFVVVAAPVGVFVPVLPAFYTTVWFGGIPYYYANDTYYAWRGEQQGYEVIPPPQDPAAAGQPPDPSAPAQPPPAADDLYIYPQQDQTDDQQATDRYECHRWAATQSGFDPTVAAGGVAADQTDARRADYQRAMRACLEGRGYSVR